MLTVNLFCFTETSPFAFRDFGLKVRTKMIMMNLFFCSWFELPSFDIFFFQNIKLSIDGTSYPNYTGINVDFTTQPGKVESYLSLMHGFLLSDQGLYSSFDDLKTNCMWSFDLGNFVNLDNDHQAKLRSGNGRVCLSFKEGTKNPNLTLICFMLTDECLTVTKDRIVNKGYIS